MSYKKTVTFTANVADFTDGTVTARVQAEKFNAWRDACWATARKIREDVQAGKIARPTYAEAMEAIPDFSWDD